MYITEPRPMHIIGYPKLYNVRKRSQDGKSMTDEHTTLWLDMFAHWQTRFEWILSEKIDGTNLRIIFDHYGGVEFRGRTDKAELHKDLVKHLMETFVDHDENGEPKDSGAFDRVVTVDYGNPTQASISYHDEPKLKAKDKFKALKGCILFGEGFGAGIQKGGGNYSPTKSFIAFDIWRDNNADRGQWYEWHTVQEITKELDIPMVQNYTEELCPDLKHSTIAKLEEWIAKKPISHFGRFDAEGIVIRPKWNLFDSRGGRIMLKIKVCDYV